MTIRKQLLALIACSVLVACGGGEKKSGGGGGGSADKNTLVIALKSTPPNLDVRAANDNASGRLYDLICSGLVCVTPNFENASYVAWNWQGPDNKTIIF